MYQKLYITIFGVISPFHLSAKYTWETNQNYHQATLVPKTHIASRIFFRKVFALAQKLITKKQQHF